MNFEESIAELKNCVGRRNAMLTGVVRRGLFEGMTPDAIAETFASRDCGDPPLTPQEIKRAISRAVEYSTGEANTNTIRVSRLMNKMREIREGTSPEERHFVRRMISRGETACGSRRCGEVLRGMSKLSIISHAVDAVRMQSVAYVKSVFGGLEGYILAIDKMTDGRTKDRMFTADELCEKLETSEDAFSLGGIESRDKGCSQGYICPSHVGTNLYTGENKPTRKGGGDSYANKKNIKTRCNVLMEFDDLCLEKQIHFWIGCIISNSFDVRAITATRGKSLHGIIRINEEMVGDDLFGNVSELAAEQKRDREVGRIFRLCCTDEDMDYHADAACKDATRMTRFPGGMRYEKMVRHLLVWCKN